MPAVPPVIVSGLAVPDAGATPDALLPHVPPVVISLNDVVPPPWQKTLAPVIAAGDEFTVTDEVT